MKTQYITLCLALAAMLTPSSSHADDLALSPFSLRFPAAFGRLSVYGDVAAKSGASAASRWESSPNPANKSWDFQQDYDFRASGQYSNVAFDNGTYFNFTSETLAFDAGELGVIRVGFLHATTNEDVARGALPLPYEFDLNLGQISWAKKLSSSFALGADVNFARSQTAFKLPAFDLAHTNKDSWSFRLGGLWQPADKWFVGLYGDYANGAADTTVQLPTPLGIAKVQMAETVQQWLVHPGIAYEFMPNAMIHADYEAGWIFNDTQSLQVQRVAVGTDIPLAKFFYLRTGAALDSHNNLSWSTGIGFYPSKHVFFDIAYQNDAFPEVKQEFGRSRTLNACISMQW